MAACTRGLAVLLLLLLLLLSSLQQGHAAGSGSSHKAPANATYGTCNTGACARSGLCGPAIHFASLVHTSCCSNSNASSCVCCPAASSDRRSYAGTAKLMQSQTTDGKDCIPMTHNMCAQLGLPSCNACHCNDVFMQARARWLWCPPIHSHSSACPALMASLQVLCLSVSASGGSASAVAGGLCGSSP